MSTIADSNKSRNRDLSSEELQIVRMYLTDFQSLVFLEKIIFLCIRLSRCCSTRTLLSGLYHYRDIVSDLCLHRSELIKINCDTRFIYAIFIV